MAAEFPIARLYADIRVNRIYGGTSEVMKTIIANWLAPGRAREPGQAPACGALLQLRAPAGSASQHELSEQAMCLVIWPGREDQLVGLGGVPVAETQAPQAVDGDRVAVGPA